MNKHSSAKGVWIVGIVVSLVTGVIIILFIQPVLLTADKSSQLIQFQKVKRAEQVIDRFFFERIHHLTFGIFILEQETEIDSPQLLSQLIKGVNDIHGFVRIQYLTLDGDISEEVRISEPSLLPPLSFSLQTLKKFSGDPSEKFIVGNAFYFNNTPYVDVAIASEQQLSQVLVATIELSQLWKDIQSLSLSESDVLYIVDRKGSIVFHERPKDVVVGKTNILSRRVVSKVLREGTTVRNLIPADKYVNERGEKVRAVGIPLPKYKLGVFLERTEAVIFAEKNTILRFVLIGIGLIGLALFIMARSLLALGRTIHGLEEAQLKMTQLLRKLQEWNKESNEIARVLVRRDIELTESNERLRGLDTIKSEFVSVAAHQLRTPLTGIKWTLNALREEEFGKLGRDQKKLVSDGLGATYRLIELINDLLDTARIEEGRYGFSFSSQSLAPVVEHIFERYEKTAKEKGINFLLQLPKGRLPLLYLDAEKIGIVIDNLIDNAIKYTVPGGTVTVQVVKDRQYVRVNVQDTGIGIPKKQEGRVFTKFFRAANAQLAQTSGTGLGLYVAQNIVQQHKGTLSFTSKENKGTTFTLSLPISASRRALK